MNFKEIEKQLKKDNWILIRTLCFNYQYKKIGYDKTIIIPNYGSKHLPIDVVKNLEKTTGLSLLR